MRSKLIDKALCYIYPMANSLRGGAIASETNIRDLFGVLLSKSSAKTANDFAPLMDDTTSWYSIIGSGDSQNTTKINIDLKIGKGKGNCNGYYVDLTHDVTEFNVQYDVDTPSDQGQTDVTLYVYFRIVYSGTGICDGSYLWVGNKDEVDEQFENYQPYGFYDIGILLGTIDVKLYNDAGNLNLICRYKYNSNIMNCIDVDRLGNAAGNYISQFYNKLNRLYKLMIDNGFISVGTVLQNKVNSDGYRFNPEPGQNGHDFNLISPYKIQMYIEPSTFSASSVDISGSEGTLSLNPQISPNSIVVNNDPSIQVTYNDNLTEATFDNVTINLITGVLSRNSEVTNTYISYQYTKDYYYNGGLKINKYNEDIEQFDDNTSQEFIKFTSIEDINNSENSIITQLSIFNNNFIFDSTGLKLPQLNINNAVTISANKSSNETILSVVDSANVAIPVIIHCGGIDAGNGDILTEGDIRGGRVYGAVWQ